jgi:hypothetical protein
MKTARLALGWILVGVPLVYGIATTLAKASALFG